MRSTARLVLLVVAAFHACGASAEEGSEPGPASRLAIGGGVLTGLSSATAARVPLGVGATARTRVGPYVLGLTFDGAVNLSLEGHSFLGFATGPAWFKDGGERHLLLLFGTHRIGLDDSYLAGAPIHRIPYVGLRIAGFSREKTARTIFALSVMQDLRREDAPGYDSGRVGGTTALVMAGVEFGIDVGGRAGAR